MIDVTLTEELQARMVVHFAEQLGIHSQELAAILDGYGPVTRDLIVKLVHVFPDTPPEYWIALADGEATARSNIHPIDAQH